MSESESSDQEKLSISAFEPKNGPEKFTEEQIKNLIADHWTDGLKIRFWREVSEGNIRDSSNLDVQEAFARYKILPKFLQLDDLLALSLNKISDLQKLNRSVTVTQFLRFKMTIFGRAKRKANRDTLAVALRTLDPVTLETLFPLDGVWKVQNLFMALQDRNRNDWSERTYDNLLYSAIFQCYFKDDFRMLGDQKVNEYLPPRVANEIAPDLVLLSEESPFLICEYGTDEDASNHQDLLKLIDTMQRALIKRYEHFPESTNEIYGVLCGGDELTFFLMEHDRKTGNFPCYFISESANDLQTTTLEVVNFGTILSVNVIILIGGNCQITSEITPSKLDSSVHQTGKTSQSQSNSSSSNCASMSSENASNDDDTSSGSKAKEIRNEAKEIRKEKAKRKAILAQVTQLNAILNNKYKISEKITEVVHRASFNGRDYVAKFLFANLRSAEEDILSQLSDNFVKPVDSFDVGDGLRCVVFPFLERQAWKTYREFRRSAYQVIAAISELHERNVMHGDIKYSNIIRTDENTYLIDFDLAVKDPETYKTKFHGTFGHRAPESMKNGTLSLEMDIYSYGILLYELLHQQKMQKLVGVDDDEEKVVANLRTSIEKEKALLELINRCLTPDPVQRPTAKEILADPFFDQERYNSPVKSGRGTITDEISAN